MKFKEDVTITIPDIPPIISAASILTGKQIQTSKKWQNLVRNTCIKDKIRLIDSELYGVEITFAYPKHSKTKKLKKGYHIDRFVEATLNSLLRYIITPNKIGIDRNSLDEIGTSRLDAKSNQTTITLYAISKEGDN